MFRRERRDAGKAQILALGKGFAQADRAVVGDADDVAGKGLVVVLRSRAMKVMALFSRSSCRHRPA